jgi:putative copper export protein
VKQFAAWLSTTFPSLFIQEHNIWVIPTIQSIHIVGIAIVMGSVLMIDLRILGWAGMDQTLRQTIRRFGPWLTGSLWLLLATGTVVALIFQAALRRHEPQWENALVQRPSIKGLAILTFLIWACVIVLGRLIAYDHVWGAWSPAERQ